MHSAGRTIPSHDARPPGGAGMQGAASSMTDSAADRAMFVQLDERSGVLRARVVVPNIGQREATVIQDALADALDQASSSLRCLMLDLSSVSFMNSMGLGMCIDARNRASEKGAKAVIYGLNAELTGLFEMTKIDRLFKLVKDEVTLEKVLKK